MKKESSLTIAFVSLLLLSTVAGPIPVKLASANPTTFNYTLGTRAPDSNTKPPIISFAPANHTTYATNDISLSINVIVGESSTASLKYIDRIYYKTSWQKRNFSIYECIENPYYVLGSTESLITQFSKTLNFKGFPDGNHSLVVYVKERGGYHSHTDITTSFFCYEYYYLFEIDAFSSFFFTVDTPAPSISVLSMQDMTFYSYDIDLRFVVNELTSRSAYSLDAGDNVTIAGNTTLSGLSVGEHNLTIYAWDRAGNVGASETIYFRIKDPFIKTLVIAIVVTVMVTCVGLIVYVNKRKR